MTTKSLTPIKLFYSYAYERRDERLRNELEKHLSSLRNQGYISDWHNRQIVAGKEWAREVDEHLNTANIILLLVSPDFMASDYCNDVEVKRAMERHEAREARVIPIILRPVDWHDAPFGKLQALPGNGKSVSSWQNTDEALYHVAQEIRKAIELLPAEKNHISTTSRSSSSPSSSITRAENTNGLERPATVMLSYAREDAAEVNYLQLQLKVRGVRAWRDVTDLPLGGATEDEIVQAIENVADAFVLHITPHSLKSAFVWNIEIPTALKRRERDPLFKIVPVLHGVSYQQLQDECADRGYQPLTAFNAVRLPDNPVGEADELLKEKLRSIAERVLKATLTLRLHRVKAGRDYEPSLVLRTFRDIPPTSSLDLDLNWWDLFHGRDRVPPAEEWRDILFPALQDVKNTLGELTISRKLHMSLQAILPAAFALGYTFPAPARYTLLLESKDGIWYSAGSVDTPLPLRRASSNKGGDKQTAIVEIAIAQPISRAVTDYLSASPLSYVQRISYSLPDGPDHLKGVRDASHALAIVQQIGKDLRLLCGQGITHIHLFAVIPAALAVMLGCQFNALCPISLYHYVENKRYEWACTLGLAV